MAVNSLLVKAYTNSIYNIGSMTFPELAEKREEYIEPVKQFAATFLYIEDLDYSLKVGHISQEEYDQTMAYKKESDPQNRPIGKWSNEPTEQI